MTQLEKAKAYDEALERANKLKETCDSNAVVGWMEYIFPELKESEDERIKKDIIDFVRHSVNRIPAQKFNKYIAWLEKQGEKIPDKIVEKARTEKQKVLLTETDGNASIDWDCRSLDDVKTLLKCGLEFIRTIEANKQTLTDSRFGGCSFRVPTRYDKGIKQGEQKPIKMWHDVSEVPDEMQELLVEWESPDATWHDIAFYDAETKAFRHLKQPINNVTRWAYVSDILSQSVTKTSKQGWSDALERQGEKKPKKTSIWKHWKDGIAGNGEDKLIYLIKNYNDYLLSSCLGFECDYIELSELDNLLVERK